MATKILLAIIVLTACLPSEAFARRRSYSSYNSVPAGCSNATAQGVAEIQARLGRVGHFGGNSGYEGCGCGFTPEAALSSCCYSSSGMPVVDQGVAQGANGMWYATKRYGR